MADMNEPPTDRELLTHYSATSSEASFSLIVERHSRMVYGTCLKILRDAHLAEDATQATFLLFVRHAKKLSNPEILSHWLFRTARTAALNALKLKERSQRHERQAACLPAGRCEREVQAGESEIFSQVYATLALLPAVQREALILRYLEGRSQAEAALELGCPEETVHTRVTRGISKLRSVLKRKGVDLSVSMLVPLLGEIGTPPPSLNANIVSVCTGRCLASSNALEIAREVFKSMFINRAMWCTAAALFVLVCSIGVHRMALSAEQSPTRDSEPVASRPSADKMVIEKRDAAPEFGPESDGLVANLSWLSNDEAAPFAFGITVKNVSAAKLEPIGINASHMWVFYWQQLDPPGVCYRGKFSPDGGGCLPVALYKTQSRTFQFQDSGGHFYWGNALQSEPYMAGQSGSEGPEEWSELPPGRYRVSAEYWGDQPNFKIEVNGRDNRYRGKLKTNSVIVAVATRPRPLDPDGFGENVNGLSAKLTLLSTKTAKPLVFSLVLRNSDDQEIKWPSCEAIDWTFCFHPLDGGPKDILVCANGKHTQPIVRVDTPAKTHFQVNGALTKPFLKLQKGARHELKVTLGDTIDAENYAGGWVIAPRTSLPDSGTWSFTDNAHPAPVSKLPPGRYAVTAIVKALGERGNWYGKLVSSPVEVLVQR